MIFSLYAVEPRAARYYCHLLLQGSAADIVKEAMIRCTEKLRLAGVHARLCAQIHDELLFEVAETSLLTTASLVKREMEQMDALDVGGYSLPPLPVCIVAGHTWSEMRAVEC